MVMNNKNQAKAEATYVGLSRNDFNFHDNQKLH